MEHNSIVKAVDLGDATTGKQRMTQIAMNVLAEHLAEEAKTSHAPKYVCVFEAFTKCIHSGQFRPGERLPTETELSQRLPVSVGTVQKALSKLADSGLVVRNRKTGTFVADRSSRAPETHVYRFKDPLSGEMLLPFTRVLRVEIDKTKGPWSITLRCKRLVRIDRLVWIEQDPPAFSSVYVAFEHGKGMLKKPLEELHGSSWHRFLIESFNLPTLRMDHKFGCRELDARACDALLVREGTVGIAWDITDFSFEERPVLFQRYQLPPSHRPIELSELRN
jgi:GntR family transcriptional regulator